VAVISVWLHDARIEKDGDSYIAYSDQLKLVGCGVTADDAAAELRQVIIVSLKALEHQGKLELTLNKMGIPFQTIEPREIGRRTTTPFVLETV
jgi:hypothetical protein